jgi:ribosomal protein S5
VSVNQPAKGGRALVASCSSDEKWCCDHGLGKSKDVSEAIKKAVEDAKKI